MLAEERERISREGKILRIKAGYLLAKLREESGLLQIELAEMMGQNHTTKVSGIEHGNARLPATWWPKYAEIFGINKVAFGTLMAKYYKPHTYKIINGDGDLDKILKKHNLLDLGE